MIRVSIEWEVSVCIERCPSTAEGWRSGHHEAKSCLREQLQFHIFLQSNNQVFTRPKKGRHLQIDEAKLHVASEIQAKGLLISC